MRESNEKYEIIETIATGGMAVLYKGVQVSLKRTVVIKKLHPHLAADKNFVERFEREAKILGQMNHPNIVNIIDYFVKDGEYYIVLEYIEGFSLAELIRKQGALPLSVSVHILQEVLRGLIYAHSKKVLHRDIKPDNVMIERSSAAVKLTDFGLATGEAFKDLTKPGGYIGTVAYLAPEIIRGEKPTIQSDIYSAGITFCEMLTGTNPMKGDSEYDVINKILYHKKIELEIPATMPEKVKSIFNKMVAFNPEDRYKSCQEILYDLEELPFVSKDQFKEFIESPVIKSGSIPRARVSISTSKKWRQSLTGIFLIVIAVIAGLLGSMIFYKLKVKDNDNSYRSYNKRVVQKDTVNQNTKMINKKDTLSSSQKREGSLSQKDKKKKEKIMKEKGSEINPLPKDSGYVYISVKPWADVYIDNKYIDKTPISYPLKLTKGKHKIKLYHPHRKVYEGYIDVKKNDTLRLTYTLQESYGYVKIIVKPWASVFIDGEKIGVTPMANPIRLSIGKHTITFKNPRYDVWEKIVEIKENDTLVLSVDLSSF